MDDLVFIGIVAVFWFGFSAAVGAFARTKGRDATSWFALALFLSPLIAFVSVAVMAPYQPGLVASRKFKKCPQCAESVRSEAIICRFCRFEFPANSIRVADESEDATAEPATMPRWFLPLIYAGVVLSIVGTLWRALTR